MTMMIVVKEMYIDKKIGDHMNDPDVTWCRVQRSDITNYDVPLRVTVKCFNVKADK